MMEVLPLIISMLILGSISFARWKRVRRSGVKSKLQFFLSDYLVSICCIGAAAMVMHWLKSPWDSTYEHFWLFMGATLVGLINGKAWHLTRGANKGLPDSAYLAIGAGSGIAIVANTLPVMKIEEFAAIPIVFTVALLGSVTLIRWIHFRYSRHLHVNYRFELPDLAVFAVCVALTVFVIRDRNCLALLVPTAIAGAALGKFWCLMSRRSSIRARAVYMGLGAVLGCTTIIASFWGYFILTFPSGFNFNPAP